MWTLRLRRHELVKCNCSCSGCAGLLSPSSVTLRYRRCGWPLCMTELATDADCPLMRVTCISALLLMFCVRDLFVPGFGNKHGVVKYMSITNIRNSRRERYPNTMLSWGNSSCDCTVEPHLLLLVAIVFLQNACTTNGSSSFNAESLLQCSSSRASMSKIAVKSFLSSNPMYRSLSPCESISMLICE